MKDDYGKSIKVGDTLSLSVGIPGRDVIVAVEDRRGRFVAVNDEGSMSLSDVLKFFPTEIVQR